MDNLSRSRKQGIMFDHINILEEDLTYAAINFLAVNDGADLYDLGLVDMTANEINDFVAEFEIRRNYEGKS